MSRQIVRTALVTILAVVGASQANATGYWNMPCTVCQWCGHGFGGGYHAPMLLGPVTWECVSGPNEVRLPYAPNPYACAPCEGDWIYRGRPTMGEQQTALTPIPQPAPAVQSMVPPGARRTIYAAPVQR